MIEDEEIARQIREAIARQRGYADYFTWPDQELEEWGATRLFLESAISEPGAPFRDLVSRGQGNDPPDCEVTDAVGNRIGLELTELVDRRAIKQRKRNPFYIAPWDATKLRNALSERLKAKDVPERVKGGPYAEYFLIIYSDELFADRGGVEQWLSGYKITPPRLLTRAYLMLSYDPAVQSHPYVRLSW